MIYLVTAILAVVILFAALLDSRPAFWGALGLVVVLWIPHF